MAVRVCPEGPSVPGEIVAPLLGVRLGFMLGKIKPLRRLWEGTKCAERNRLPYLFCEYRQCRHGGRREGPEMICVSKESEPCPWNCGAWNDVL